MRHPTLCQLSGALLASLAAVSLQGCKRIDVIPDWTPAAPSPTVYLEDSVLASRVRAALILSPVVNSFNISVESHQGIVLLTGMAADATQADLAVFVAQTVPGVSSVNNFMHATGMPLILATNKGATTDPAALHPGVVGHVLRTDPPGMEVAASDNPIAVASWNPPPIPDHGPTAYGAPTPSRWVRLAHRVLGIHSIQEELLIKP